LDKNLFAIGVSLSEPRLRNTKSLLINSRPIQTSLLDKHARRALLYLTTALRSLLGCVSLLSRLVSKTLLIKLKGKKTTICRSGMLRTHAVSLSQKYISDTNRDKPRSVSLTS